MGRLWSYILPLPVESVEQLKVLLSVFSSRITIELLKNIRLEGKTYQKELLEKLPYSSKTIIQKLKQLVASEVLEEGLEQKKTKGKTVWIKWYTPTFIGKWIIMLLTPLEEIDPKQLSTISKELFKIYAGSLAELCLNFGMRLEDYHEILDREYISRVPFFLNKRGELDVVIFDIVSLNIYLRFDDLKNVKRAEYLSLDAGSSGARVATALSKLGIKTVFVGKCGIDYATRKVLDFLLTKGVGFACSGIEKTQTPFVLTVTDREGREKILAIGGEALSLKSPSEVHWDLVDQCKVVYMGEIRKEAAELISSYSRSKGNIVVYRPSLLFLKYRLEDLAEFLNRVDVLIVDDVSLRELGIKEGEYGKLLESGADAVIRVGADGVYLYTENKTFHRKMGVRDTRFFGDLLSAGLIKSLLSGKSVEDAVKEGIKIAKEIKMELCE